MNRLRLGPAMLLSVSVFSLLFGATYRNDAAYVEESRFFADAVQLPLVAAIKSVSVVAFAVPVLAALILFVARFPARAVLGWLTSILTVLAIVLMLRLMPEASANSIKILITTGMIALLVPMAMCTAAVGGSDAVARALFGGALAFAAFHSLLNAGMGLGGYGFHNARFLGTTLHPNFIGVQMATCAVLALGGFSSRMRANILPAVVLAASVTAMVMAGSRTGLATFGVGLLGFFAMRGVKLWQFGLLIVLAPLMIGYAAIGESTDVNLEQYDRGNTRAQTWVAMWESVNEAPLIGHGTFPIDSENSYLRGWSAIGIVYVLAYLAFLMAALRAALVLKMRQAASQPMAFNAMLFGMMAGAVTEGYLLDTMSFPVIMLIVATLAVDSAMPGMVARRRMRRLPPPRHPAAIRTRSTDPSSA